MITILKNKHEDVEHKYEAHLPCKALFTQPSAKLLCMNPVFTQLMRLQAAAIPYLYMCMNGTLPIPSTGYCCQIGTYRIPIITKPFTFIHCNLC